MRTFSPLRQEEKLGDFYFHSIRPAYPPGQNEHVVYRVRATSEEEALVKLAVERFNFNDVYPGEVKDLSPAERDELVGDARQWLDEDNVSPISVEEV